MLIRTGLGSISFVAGCCWVNAVVPNRASTSASASRRADGPDLPSAQVKLIRGEGPGDTPHHAQ